ncbi:MAG: single-stranded DNA-binding protein [Planctomycetota bacterium]
MASYNRVILVGNLTRDPQLSYTQSNMAVCKFGLAINHKWKDREGASKEEVCFVDCTVFGRAGETFNQYMTKGRPVLVEGRLHLNQWTTAEGEKRSKHEIVVENFTFLGGGRGGTESEGDAPAGRSAGNRSFGGAGGSELGPSAPDDDIPF